MTLFSILGTGMSEGLAESASAKVWCRSAGREETSVVTRRHPALEDAQRGSLCSGEQNRWTTGLGKQSLPGVFGRLLISLDSRDFIKGSREDKRVVNNTQHTPDPDDSPSPFLPS